MDMTYVNKVRDEISEEGLSELETKIKLYDILFEKLQGKDRSYLKMLELEIQNLEDEEMDFTDRLVIDMEQYDEDNSQDNLVDFDEDNIGCVTGERPEEDLDELNFS